MSVMPQRHHDQPRPSINRPRIRDVIGLNPLMRLLVLRLGESRQLRSHRWDRQAGRGVSPRGLRGFLRHLVISPPVHAAGGGYPRSVNTGTYAAWGAAGGLAVELLDFYAAIRHVRNWPWTSSKEPRPLPYAASVLIRLAIGAVLAAAAGSSGQLSSPFGALGIGIGAPLVIEKLARNVPVQQAPDQPATPPPGALPSQPVRPDSSYATPSHSEDSGGERS
jgi:hypothetical protein